MQRPLHPRPANTPKIGKAWDKPTNRGDAGIKTQKKDDSSKQNVSTGNGSAKSQATRAVTMVTVTPKAQKPTAAVVTRSADVIENNQNDYNATKHRLRSAESRELVQTGNKDEIESVTSSRSEWNLKSSVKANGVDGSGKLEEEPEKFVQKASLKCATEKTGMLICL